MRVILFGATGMVGAGVLLECVADARVESVVAIVRSSTGRSHPKLREILHTDFFNYDDVRAEFASCDACFFCLGVTSVGLDEAAYTRLTYDLTTAAARAMADTNPDMTFCYVSGIGTNSTERSRTMWSRVKGRTKNAILALPFKPRTRTHPVARQDEHVRRPGSDESWRETTYEMRLRFEAIPFRREMMINTITTNRTPETTRIIVGSIEAHSLHVHGTRYGCRSASPQHLGSKEVERQFWIQDHV